MLGLGFVFTKSERILFMKRTNKKVELLAPAGNKEGFYGAIHAGADAVYLGGVKFGARAYADNFTEAELIECIRYAHLWGRKVYLTVNTLIKETEYQELYPYLCPLYQTGLDGVIVQDIGVFQYIKRNFPKMELHASTQMTLTSRYGAKLLKEMGACRIVPARELSLQEIQELKESVGIEIETFIHGAMCYCYSGQCLFSSILGGRSGNRGRCAQPCRLPYRLECSGKQTKEAYLLSLKDMCMIDYLAELIEAGIDSFKIEGRMKRPEYTAGVTAIYRKYIDKYYQNPKTKIEIAKKDREALSHLYIRSNQQSGYYYKQNGADMVTLDSPAYNKTEESLLEQIRKTYLLQKPKKQLMISAVFQVGKPAQLIIKCENLSVEEKGKIVEKAEKQPISKQNIEKQLKKLGETIFIEKEISIILDENAFYPLKEINELRRKAIVKLENKLIQQQNLCIERSCSLISKKEKREGIEEIKEIERIEEKKNWIFEKQSNKKNPTEETEKNIPILNLSIQTAEQLEELKKRIEIKTLKVYRIYLDADIFTKNRLVSFTEAIQAIKKLKDIEIFLSLPYILRQKEIPYLEELFQIANLPEIDGCMVRSLDGYGFLLEKEYQRKIAADTGFYLWNKEGVRYFKEKLTSFCLPLELNAKEQHFLVQGEGFPFLEKIIYGRIPMMITANCVVKTVGDCQKDCEKQQKITLIDRYQKQFPVVKNKMHCINIIYNSIPLSLHKTCKEWGKDVILRLNFTIEDKKAMGDILDYFQALLFFDVKTELPYTEYTLGHEKRGVE